MTKSQLKVDHIYRVVGPPMRSGTWNRQPENFEALRYTGTVVPYQNHVPDVNNQIETFYSFAHRHYVLFKSGDFQADELID